MLPHKLNRWEGIAFQCGRNGWLNCLPRFSIATTEPYCCGTARMPGRQFASKECSPRDTRRDTSNTSQVLNLMNWNLPWRTRFPRALYIAGEAQVDNRALLQAVAIALSQNKVECHWETFVPDGELPNAGIVVDCRGMGAKRNWPRLRGVRGEIVRLHAPEIELHCMLRLLHPRYPVYIIPRAEGRLVVGATSIESDDHSNVSVRGALELLTSAYSVLPALAEARILEFNTQVRAALSDNAPAIHFDRQRKALYINGLYRHGFLLTPAIVEETLAFLSLQQSPAVGRWPFLHENRSELIFAPTENMRACL